MKLMRFRADIAYEPDNEGEAPELYDLIEEARKRIGAAVVINEGDPEEERGYFIVENCYHDETPPKPCDTLERWEAGKGQVI